jgi:hypothetical protein
MQIFTSFLMILFFSSFCFAQFSFIGRSKDWEVSSYGIFDEGKKDVKSLAEIICTISRKKKIGCSTIEIKTQPSLEKQADKMLEMLEKSFVSTQEILGKDVSLDDVRIYVLDGKQPSSGYHYALTSSYPLFQMILYLPREENNLDCNKQNQFCDSIFWTLPHELTHPKISSETRWLEESICNLVGQKVSEKFSVAKNREIYLPLIKVLAGNEDFRKNIFSWQKSDEVDKLILNQTKKIAEITRYEAAYFILSQTIENKQNANFFQNLIDKIIEKKRNFPWDLTLENFEEIFSQNDVELRNFPQLSQEEKTKIAEQANSDLAERKNAYYAAITLFLLKSQLSQESLNVVIEDFIAQPQNSLAAKLLQNQINQPMVNQIISDALKKKGLKNIEFQRKQISLKIQKFSKKPIELLKYFSLTH